VLCTFVCLCPPPPFRCVLTRAAMQQENTEALVPRGLFGGAIMLSLPQRFVDVSDFRPVPDNQEACASAASGCYLAPQDGHSRYDLDWYVERQVYTDASVDQSLIVEVLVLHTMMHDALCVGDHKLPRQPAEWRGTPAGAHPGARQRLR